MNTADYGKFEESWISDASRRKWACAIKIFEDLKKWKNETDTQEIRTALNAYVLNHWKRCFMKSLMCSWLDLL